MASVEFCLIMPLCYTMGRQDRLLQVLWQNCQGFRTVEASIGCPRIESRIWSGAWNSLESTRNTATASAHVMLLRTGAWTREFVNHVSTPSWKRKARTRWRDAEGAQKRFNSTIKKQQWKRVSLAKSTTRGKGHRKETMDVEANKIIKEQWGDAIDQSRR